jgi:hypothetical protein
MNRLLLPRTLSWALPCALLLCTACASHIETRPYSAQTDDAGIAGIRYYEPRLYKAHYEYTALIDRNGLVVGKAGNGTCTAVTQKDDLITLADYSHPRVLIEHPAPFASDKLGVSLSNGVLTGLNVEHSPQGNDLAATLEKAAEATVFVAAAAGGAGGTGAGGTPACNTAAELERIELVTLP